MKTDTAQMKGATACNDRSQKNHTPGQAYIVPPVTSTGDATGNDAADAETGSRSQPTTDKGNGKNGAHVTDEGERKAKPKKPKPKPKRATKNKPKKPKPKPFKRGDHQEIAERLVHDRCQRSAFVHSEGRFWQYDTSAGVFRAVDDAELSRQVQSYAGARVQGIGGVLNLRIGDVKGAIKLAADLVDEPDYFEGARAGIGFADCFVEVTDEGIVRRPHAERHRARFAFPFAYADAEPEMFLRFFDSVFQGDADATDKVRAIQEHTGISMLGKATDYQRALFLVGTGSNGKGVLAKILGASMPQGSVCVVPPQLLGNEYRRAMLAGKLLNIVAELPARDFTESEPFKSAIAGDLMDARPIKREPFTFLPCAGHIYSANTLPGTTDQTHGFWRRMVVIMFLRTFDGADADVGLAERIIEAERAAIVSWALRGAQRLLRQGRYTEPVSSKQNVEAWRDRSDDVRAFLDDLALVKLEADEPQSHGFAPGQLHAAYRAWAAECGTETVLSGKAFGQRMRLLGFEPRHDETKAPKRRYRLRHPTPAEREAILRERAAREAKRV